MSFDPDFDNDLAPSDAALSNVAALANRQLELEAEVAELEEQLKNKINELRKISDDELPTALKQAGLDEIKLESGVRITVKDELTCSVSADKKPWVLNWLRKHKHDDIIKKEVAVIIPKGSDPKVLARLQKGIERLELDYAVEENFNTGTLKALIKEQLENGKPLQLDKFGAFQINKAKITLPKA
jgi:chaperonin cofactor prefoldin